MASRSIRPGARARPREETRAGADVRPRADDEDVLAAQRGDEDAFVTLYRHLQPSLLRYLTVLVGEDAEDIAGETWMHTCRDLGRFRGGLDDFRGWVITIARHRALDHLRAARRRLVVLTAPEDMPRAGTEPDVSVAAEQAAATQQALRLIASLPPDQAEAVLLRAVVGLDANTAGAVLGKRAGAVRTAAHRGLRTLARRLGDPNSSGETGVWAWSGIGVGVGPAAGGKEPGDAVRGASRDAENLGSGRGTRERAPGNRRRGVTRGDGLPLSEVP